MKLAFAPLLILIVLSDDACMRNTMPKEKSSDFEYSKPKYGTSLGVKLAENLAVDGVASVSALVLRKACASPLKV